MLAHSRRNDIHESIKKNNTVNKEEVSKDVGSSGVSPIGCANTSNRNEGHIGSSGIVDDEGDGEDNNKKAHKKEVEDNNDYDEEEEEGRGEFVKDDKLSDAGSFDIDDLAMYEPCEISRQQLARGSCI